MSDLSPLGYLICNLTGKQMPYWDEAVVTPLTRPEMVLRVGEVVRSRTSKRYGHISFFDDQEVIIEWPGGDISTYRHEDLRRLYY